MIRKLVAIVLAVLINCAVLAWFHTWSTAAVANAAPPTQRAAVVLRLPTITVHPTRVQLETLRRDRKPPVTSSVVPTGDGGMQTLVMPYYSFADTPDASRNG